MLYLMTNRINIIIIILLTIKIISLKAKQQPMANNRYNDNDELYEHFTAIEFLKELEHSKPTYDSILIMKNQNATISSNFYTHLIKVSNGKYNNDTASTSSKQGFSVLSETATTTFVNSLMDSLQVPVLQLNELQSCYLKRQYSEHLLSIVYIDINIEGIQMTLNDHKGLLEKLSRNLLHMTTSKVMFLLNFSLVARAVGKAAGTAAAPPDEDVIEGILMQLFLHCWQQKIINVVALLADYQTTRKFYSYTHFPEFQLEVKIIASNPNEQEEIFPYRLGNLKGFKVPLVVGGTDHRTILYQTRDGKIVVGGFVGHFIETFAEKFNCLLMQTLPLNLNTMILSKDLVDIIRNGSAEIASRITHPGRNLWGFTYPIELVNWCVMVPVEANIPGYLFFTSVFKGETYLLVIGAIVILSMVLSAALYLHGYHADLFDIVCHDNCLRGILSQSFSEIANPPKIIRFMYLKICILGILLTTSYSSYFSTYVTRPPKEAFLHTFDDIQRSGLKVAIWEYEYKLLGNFVEFNKYKAIFHPMKNFQDFFRLRDSFNTKYGYVIPYTKWTIIKEQQKVFTTPLFRHSDNLCFSSTIPLCFPVHENSIFRPMINQLLMETAQSGLIQHWVDFGFFEMIAAKKVILKDMSANNEFRAMVIDDLRYVLIFLGGMFVVVNLVFLGELLVFHRRKVFNILRSRSRKNL